MAMTLEQLASLRDEVLDIISGDCSTGSYNAASKAFDDAEAHLSAPGDGISVGVDVTADGIAVVVRYFDAIIYSEFSPAERFAHLSAQAKVRVTEAVPNEDADVRFAHEHHLFVYEVDFGDEGKGRYVRLSDFNKVCESFAARLSQGAQGEEDEDRCVICKCLIGESDGGLCDAHKYDEKDAPIAECSAVPDGWRSTIQEAIDCIADVAQFKGNLAVGTYRHIGSKLSALLTAAPQPPDCARVVPDGMTLVPRRFVELVCAAHRATHPRAAPQLIADAIEELAAPTLAGKEGAK